MRFRNEHYKTNVVFHFLKCRLKANFGGFLFQNFFFISISCTFDALAHLKINNLKLKIKKKK